MKNKKIYERILVISDQHFPYQHQDIIPFLTAVKKQLNPDYIVNIGDECDYHAISFHEHDPDLMSAGDELKKVKKLMKPMFKLFPKASVIESNHGSLVTRKGKWAGLSRNMLKDPGEIIGAPKGWKWSFDLVLNTKLGSVYFHHGKSNLSGALAKNMSMNAVQGHAHSKFQIEYLANPEKLYWDMHVGCLADDKSLALGYNKTTLARPIVGVGVIINGLPKLIPMVLKKGGRWIGKL